MKIIDRVRGLGTGRGRRVVAALAGAGVLAAGGLAVAVGAGATTGYTVTASPDLNVRSGPGMGFGVVGNVAHGASLDISCQTRSGSFVHGSDVWDRIATGYVSDYWVNTPVFAAFSPGIPQCAEAPPGGSANAARTRVVVMGDSYASGEGTYNNGSDPRVPSVDYYPSTATGDHRCHRSPAAYAPQLGVAARDFVACSGARIADVVNGSGGEGPQVTVLDPTVKAVVLSVGGNDVDFANVLGACSFTIPIFHSADDCNLTLGNALRQLPATEKALGDLYAQIESRTQGAHLVVVGYPRIFPPGGHFGCNGIDEEHQQDFNNAADAIDEGIRSVVNQVPGATFVDVRPVFAGHEVCGASNGAYINDLQTNLLFAHNCPDDRQIGSGPVKACSQSYHPNVLAYRAEADLLRPIVDAAPRGPSPSQPAPQPAGAVGAALAQAAAVAVANATAAAGGPGQSYHVTGTCPTGGCVLLLRGGPGFSTSPATGQLHEGDAVDISCQTRGETVSQSGWGTSSVWDLLTNGSWVSDLYVNTPNVDAFSPPIPQCQNPTGNGAVASGLSRF